MFLGEAVVPYVMICCPDNKSAIFGDEIKDNYNTEIGKNSPVVTCAFDHLTESQLSIVLEVQCILGNITKEQKSSRILEPVSIHAEKDSARKMRR